MSAMFSLKRLGFATALFGVVPMFGCSHDAATKPIRTAEFVDIDRFMGDWYVVASIPTPLERNIYNAVESYKRVSEDRIDTTFTFNRGDIDGRPSTLTPTAYIGEDASNAVWGMQFIWPIRAEYRVVYVDDKYEHTIIGRSRRDYVWIMARTPNVAPTEYERLRAIVAEQGYDTSKLVRIEHG